MCVQRMKILSFAFFIGCYFLLSPLEAILDLNEMEQSFVLETKQIHLSGYSDAFNPSIARWRGGVLLNFRIRDPETSATDKFGFTWLDEHFEPIGIPQVLQIDHQDCAYSELQDPRLIVVKDRLYIIYNNSFSFSSEKHRRMLIAQVHYDGVQFFAERLSVLLDYDVLAKKRLEKNWVPFAYRDHLLLAYTIEPHCIFYPVLGSTRCETIAETKSLIQWKWGELRGGTPALEVGDEYLAFFHSTKALKTEQSDKKKLTHYFMGAYTFHKEPPFIVTKVSAEPIISKEFYKKEEDEKIKYSTWKPLRVIFPMGFVFDKHFIWVAYGRQDHEAWIVKLDRQGLLESLKPVLQHNLSSEF